MKRNSIISLLLATIWLVSGCQADSTPTTPTEEKAATPSATATIVSTPTEIPISTLSIEEILERLISGEVTFEEINTLDFEQQKVFSIALDAEMDKQRGDVQVTHTDESGKKLYLGEDGKFHPEKQTIDSTLPKVTDKEGYIHVFYKGEWIKIKGSQNIQFNDFENFPWPKTELTDPQILDEKDKHILTTPEWLFRNGSQKTMLPIIILSKEIREMNIVNWGDAGALTIYIPHENDPYSVHRSIMIGNITLYADGVTARSKGEIGELSTFWQELEENTVYYVIIAIDQKAYIAESLPDTKGQEITAAYQGLAPTNLTIDIISGKIKSNDITLIKTQALVEKLGD